MGMQQPPPLMSLNVKPPMELDLMPSVPYFDLPAGLMAPLVKVRNENCFAYRCDSELKVTVIMSSLSRHCT
jgi:hypothetical protein